MTDYKEKYLKYKTKYLDLKAQLGGRIKCRVEVSSTKKGSGGVKECPCTNTKFTKPTKNKESICDKKTDGTEGCKHPAHMHMEPLDMNSSRN